MNSFSSLMAPLHQMTLDEVVDHAVTSVGENADEAWKSACIDAIHAVCQTMDYFDTDDVWRIVEESGETTSDNRAMGAMMREAMSKGWCKQTNTVRPSTRKVCHKRKIAVWESRLFSPRAY